MSTLSTTNLKNPSSGSNNIVLATDGATTLTTAKITTLADSAGANTSTPAEIASGRAKAWVNFDGTGTVAIRASYNVSSITDNGTGDYTVNFTTAMVDANYSVNISTQTSPANGPDAPTLHYNRTTNILAAPTASAFRVSTMGVNGTAYDRDYVCCHIFR